MPNPLIVAIDTANLAEAQQLIERLSPHIGMVKLGLEFFCRHGAEGVRTVTAKGEMPFFLDLKLHDIPNTVAGAVRSCLMLKPAFLTLHALGGGAMLRAGQQEVKKANAAAKLLAVTLLTSHSAEEVKAIGVEKSIEDEVAMLAKLAVSSGIGGLVCSPHEIKRLRSALGQKVILVVPGIRPAGSDSGDQSRMMTPAEAMAAGADYLVIGRPITQAENPVTMAKEILASL